MTPEELEVHVSLGEPEALEFKRLTAQRNGAGKSIRAMLNSRAVAFYLARRRRSTAKPTVLIT